MVSTKIALAQAEAPGAAAPSPGEKFLERQQSFEDAKLILKENNKNKKKKKKDNAIKASRVVASCYRCGAPLHTSDADAPGYVDPETYELVDIVDFNGSFLSRVRDLAGSNPIVLVVTKVDLLPRDTDLNCVGDWVVEATMRKKLNVLSVHLTSSKSLVGITGVISEIQKEKKGRDVYILGSANVGKSAFINALLKTMAINDPVAASAQRYKPIQSAVPGTTLGPIQINAFLGGGKLYDTPGVHLFHRQTAVVHSEDLPILAPQSRLRGLSFPTELGFLLTPPSGGENAENWKGLESERKLQIKFEVVDRYDPKPACDIAISGLGWFTVEPVSRSHKISQPKPVETAGELILAVHVPKAVEIFVRPPIPVSKAGAEWYQYVELTEKQEEMRPKWYF
ncbi:Putative nitric oxide synthase [Glycine soja]|nr:Putative nitric oxide synthase [Glycine soja]